jgi:hypothetical protein
MRATGFAGSLRVVTKWTTRQRKRADTGGDGPTFGPVPSARRIARMMTSERNQAASAHIVATIKCALPELVTARDLLDRFHAPIHRWKPVDLETWIAEAASSLLDSFFNGIVND